MNRKKNIYIISIGMLVIASIVFWSLNKTGRDLSFYHNSISVRYNNHNISRIEVRILKGNLERDFFDNDLGSQKRDGAFTIDLNRISINTLTTIQVRGYDDNGKLQDVFNVKNILVAMNFKAPDIEKAEYIFTKDWDNFDEYRERINSDRLKVLTVEYRTRSFEPAQFSDYHKLHTLFVKCENSIEGISELKDLKNLERLSIIGGKIKDSLPFESGFKNLKYLSATFETVNFDDLNHLSNIEKVILSAEIFKGNLELERLKVILIDSKNDFMISSLKNLNAEHLEDAYFLGSIVGSPKDLFSSSSLQSLHIGSSKFIDEEFDYKVFYPSLSHVSISGRDDD